MFEKLRAWVAHRVAPPRVSSGKLLPEGSGYAKDPQTIEEGAADLVERARQGDQNAMAMICGVRDNAKGGNKRAQVACKALAKYIKENPPIRVNQAAFAQLRESKASKFAERIRDALFSGETDPVEIISKTIPQLASQSLPKAIVTVANSADLRDKEILTTIARSLGDKEQKAFALGYKHGVREITKLPPELRRAFLLGHILGTAYKLQIVRMPRAPVKILSSRVGFEFGEC